MSIEDDINKVYAWGHSPEGVEKTSGFNRNQDALSILTHTDWQSSFEAINRFGPRLENKKVVEVGAGIGFMAIEMAKRASHVVAIESDPMFNWIFATHLYKHKPDNLIWMFGDVFEIQQEFRWCPESFDVAVVFTKSGIEQMKRYASWMAGETIMYYQEYPNAN